ncbi:MAG TPA: phosphoribosylanthranilate isomerase [Candidatus Omnitrophota bacterium]|nr:phosphoribosylanthranilate isomerase [Candidatus Omnitrophota bacterium]HRY85827.1 phosphoribosylanthranilate isomerase [Candidatus Omnitrophota bacterium]
MTRVKICGNTNYEHAKLAIDLGADYLGFIFAPSSKRVVTVEKAEEIVARLADFKNIVGVFCNQPKKDVEAIAARLDLKYLQFHGEETALYCDSFMRQNYEVIKTFHVKDAMSLKRLGEYNVSAFLFDTYSQTEKGGSGIPFDWNVIGDKPYVHDKLFLAGGLNPANVAQAIEKVRPFAVDVASGVESSPGIKDPALLRAFLENAKGFKRNHERKA